MFLLLGTPMLLLEMTMGQYSALSPTKLYRNLCPVSKKVLWFEPNQNGWIVQLNRMFGWSLSPIFLLETTMGQYSDMLQMKLYRNICLASKKKSVIWHVRTKLLKFDWTKCLVSPYSTMLLSILCPVNVIWNIPKLLKFRQIGQPNWTFGLAEFWPNQTFGQSLSSNSNVLVRNDNGSILCLVTHETL